MVIRLIEKKDRDKRFIENSRPISLFNVDSKLISKTLALRLKNVLPSLISRNQTAYVKNRFISESGRLISDIKDVSDRLNIYGYLIIIDIQKAFDSVNHSLLLAVLKALGFGKDFLHWTEILLTNQESCVLNSGTTTKHFKLKKGTGQGDPISAYPFILFRKLFMMIKVNQNIKLISIFGHDFLYTAYGDDTPSFIRNKNSTLELLNVFDIYSVISGI